MGEIWTPEKAKKWLDQLGIDEDSYEAVMEKHPSLSMATGHELKTAVTIVRSGNPQDFDAIYTMVKLRYPDGKKK